MAVGEAVASAVRFLLERRNAQGWWQDFAVAGPSDAWVTAYVGTALGGIADARAHGAAADAWALLRKRQRWSGGWGYHARVPPDADTTAWALRLGEAVGAGGSIPARRGKRFLRRHVRADGGVATFALPHPIGRFTGLGSRFSGWCSAHVCASGAAAGVVAFRERGRVLAYLRTQQRGDGCWAGYWWRDPEYATALASEALAATEQPEDRRRVAAASMWAARRLARQLSRRGRDTRPSPFAVAGTVRILVAGGEVDERNESQREMVAAGIAWLVDAQEEDGGWPSSALLRVPPPNVSDPELLERWERDGTGDASIGSIVRDQRRLFTTATVLAALDAVGTALPSPASGEPAGVHGQGRRG